MKEKSDDNDYNNDFIKLVIKYCSVANPLLPFDNKNIYNNNEEINPLADFILVDKHFINLICPENKKTFVDEVINYPIKFFKEKLIIYFNEQNILIIFKKEKNNYWELIIHFIEEKEGKRKILNEIELSDINQFLKKRNFDIYSTSEIVVNESNCKFKLINKQLKLKQNKNIENIIKPQTNNEINNDALNKKTEVSPNLKNKLNTIYNINNFFVYSENKKKKC